MPSLVATAADGYPDTAFRVAAPVLLAPAGPGPAMEQTPCRPGDVIATAATRRVPGGVDGVIRIHGHTCSLHITSGPTAFLDAAGVSLPVQLIATAERAGLLGDPRSDIPLAEGDVLWGFSWRGSWCGARPSFVLVPMADDPTISPSTGPYGDLKVPLSGVAPDCDGGSDSVLQPGVAGTPSEAVQVPPPNWAGLRLTLHDGGIGVNGVIKDLAVTVSNPTGSPIALWPCPSYTLMTSNPTANGGFEDSINNGVLACAAPKVLDVGGSATYPVASQPVGQGVPGGVAAGAPVQLQLAIAGAPTAKTTTKVG
ncbi:hypothetical protein acdb102_28700 [Acidothermaceae bacterium B102]|nr:hypothetical protein acdb102_28700 [Acidothermaceae bacterium B102]